MKIEINNEGDAPIMEISEVFSGISIISTEGERMNICLRDGGFELFYSDKWYRFNQGKMDIFPHLETHPRLGNSIDFLQKGLIASRVLASALRALETPYEVLNLTSLDSVNIDHDRIVYIIDYQPEFGKKDEIIGKEIILDGLNVIITNLETNAIPSINDGDKIAITVHEITEGMRKAIDLRKEINNK